MLHQFQLYNALLQTGDILCTMDGKQPPLPGEFWRLLSRILPGEIDHIILYLGPGGRCVEAGAVGVVLFDLPGPTWDTRTMAPARGGLDDHLKGVAYPFAGMAFIPAEEEEKRRQVANYCLEQVGKPYNLNFFASEREDAFYCSQLAYKAYQQVGINLNTGLQVPKLPGTQSIIFPTEIWAGCVHQLVEMEE